MHLHRKNTTLAFAMAGGLFVSVGPLFSLETAGLQTPSDEDGAARAAQTILSQNCFRCHGTSNQEGGLRLDKADAALRGGDSGKVIEPGHAQRSLLIEYVSGKGSTVMPPEGKKLSPAEVGDAARLDRPWSALAIGSRTNHRRGRALVVPAGAAATVANGRAP